MADHLCGAAHLIHNTVPAEAVLQVHGGQLFQQTERILLLACCSCTGCCFYKVAQPAFDMRDLLHCFLPPLHHQALQARHQRLPGGMQPLLCFQPA
jgi:hypothetical protein